MRDFRDLDVWKRAFLFGKEIYKVTSGFPKSEVYGLTSQLRRAAVSISSNIAEGCGRRTSKDFVSFLHNAMGSIREVENQVMLAGEVGYLEKVKAEELVKELNNMGRMLNRFIGHVSGLEIE
ncbi:four helix bundle protein [Candidatus Pacearchaeota archaeon]|nr:four helix bundle protein [Candidatus Pacearchaeota archaeon]